MNKLCIKLKQFCQRAVCFSEPPSMRELYQEKLYKLTGAPAARKGFATTPWKCRNKHKNNKYNYVWVWFYMHFLLPCYLLLVQSVQFHPPQGLISMCRNLLKKYQTSPDMHRRADSSPVFVSLISCKYIWWWHQNKPLQTNILYTNLTLTTKWKYYLILVAFTSRGLQRKDNHK